MDPTEAAEQLQTIRTLMERAALYRRALGPIFVGIGALGVGAAAFGFIAAVGADQTRLFVGYWSAVAVLAVAFAVLRVRGQALRAHEEFWTPPTRRVASALIPSYVVAVVGTGFLTLLFGALTKVMALTLPPLWLALHGLALHAAGHFTLRGIRWMGWAFIAAATAIGAAGGVLSATFADLPTLPQAHLAMGLTFGLGHLLAGGFLLLAERRAVA